ncbi:hypothetical protein [Tropicimonas sp. S265A]|uniref:hypothetical protein n=1 Tax=Tropicimonas sp. S265A TaxID=3415134 RepID=UPI003C7E8797
MTKPTDPDRPSSLRAFVTLARDRVARVVPPGFRWLVGVLLMLGGVLGFLPILGFWMIPLGLAVAALDVMPLWRRLRKRS